MKQTILLFTILLIGCSQDYSECENSTVTINHTINNTITNTIIEIKYINNTYNLTCNTTKRYEYKGTTTRELELIRRLNFYEGQMDKYFNDSECNDNLNKTEHKLVDCEDELCKINSSWC